MPGRANAWREWEHRVLREMYPHYRPHVVARVLGRTEKAVRSRAKVMGIRRLRNYRPWTPAQVEVLRERYPHERTEAIAKDLGRGPGTVYQAAAKLGLHKSTEYLASPEAHMLTGFHPHSIASRFKQGLVPHNKGLRRPGWGPGRMKETQFKAGGKPHTWLPVGTERLGDQGYLWRKIADKARYRGGWRPAHVLAWEEVNGPVPPNHVVIFKDGNKTHLSLDNLELIDRAALMRRNSIHARVSPELKAAVYGVITLKRKITMLEKSRAKEHTAGPAQPPVRDDRETEGRGV